MAVNPQHRRPDFHRVRVNHGTLIIDLGKLYRVLSSAPHGGGFVHARSILNHQVPANPGRGQTHAKAAFAPRWEDPARYLGALASKMRAVKPIVALMTAVPMKQLVRDREQSGKLWIKCFCTVGVTNAVRAGEPATHDGRSRGHRLGTINIILVTNATLGRAAMVSAVQVITESKTATLIEQDVPSSSGLRHATGTGTDAIVVASSLDGIHRVQYSGTHTEVGAMIGKLVARCVRKGLNLSNRWLQRNHR